MKKVGLLLGGGGAKGAYQVGVLRALEEAKILKHVRYFSGTSIGAINGFLLMNKLSASEIGSIWNEFNNDIIYGKNKWSEAFSVNGLYNTSGILEKIKPHLNKHSFNKTKINGYVTLARLTKKGLFAKLSSKNYEKEVIFLNTSDDPLSHTLASAAIPLVFGEKEIDGNRYVDGGLVDNFPLTPLLNANVNLVISIGLNTKVLPKDAIGNIFWIDLTPRVDLGPFPKTSLDFSPAKIFAFYNMGYEAGKKMIAYLKSHKYMWFFGRIKLKKGNLVNMETIESIKGDR